jgi:hypothetical protein
MFFLQTSVPPRQNAKAAMLAHTAQLSGRRRKKGPE